MPACNAEPPRLSVLIPVYNGADRIGGQLACLERQVAPFPWEIVVADNGSIDATRAVLSQWATRLPVPLRVVDASARRGISHARNTAALHARGDYLAFCDDDDEVADGWVAAAGRGLAAHEAVVGVLRELVAPGEAGRMLTPGGIRHPPHLVGCNVAIRRSVLLELGGFDESLPTYGFEDSELMIRLLNAGHTLHAAPDMVLRFRRTTSRRALLRKNFQSGQSEAIVWSRILQPHERLGLAGLLAEVVLWPARCLIRPPAQWAPFATIARGTVVRAGRAVGWARFVTTGRASAPRLIEPNSWRVGDDEASGR